MVGVLDSQVIEKFKEFQKRTEKFSDLTIDEVKFEKIALSNKKYFQFIKGKNKYIQEYISKNQGEYPILGSSLKNDCIASYIVPIDINDIVNQPCVSFNKDNAKGSQPFYRDYPFLMDRHHIAILPSDKISPKYLYHSLKYHFDKSKFGWGENVASVEEVQKHAIPIPHDLNEKYTSYEIQEILVEFLEFWRVNYTDTFRNVVTRQNPIFEKIQIALIPATLKYDKTLVKSFNDFAKNKGFNITLEEIKFDNKPIVELVNISRGKVISKEDLLENGLYPVYSSQTKEEGLFGFVNDYMFDGDGITWTTDGKHAGTTFLRSGKFNYTNVCGLMTIKDEQAVAIKYLSFITKEIFPKHVDRTSQNSKLMTHHLDNIFISLPTAKGYNSLNIQNLIVEFWDIILHNIHNQFKRFDNIIRLTDKIDNAFLYKTFCNIEWSDK